MRRTSILALALLALGATPAAPQGFNLYWDACGAADGHVQTLFACDANTPPVSMFASVYPLASMSQFAAVSVVLDFYIAGGVVPPWWQTASGQCRQAAIRPSYHSGDLPDTEECPSIWQGTEAFSVYSVQAIPNDPGGFRFSTVAAVPQGSELALVADGRQRVVVRVTVLRSKTVGADACEGCRTGGCIWLQQIDLLSPTEPRQTLVNAETNAGIGHNAATYLSSQGTICEVPTVNRTWGAIKTLYR